MSNFQFLFSEEEFVPFGEIAASAEKILHIDPAACILNCRRAMEFAVKWMYSVDKELETPDNDNLQFLMNRSKFRQIVGKELHTRMDFIRVKGNLAAHNTGKKITEEMAMICLENLHVFLDFVVYCYGSEYTKREFDPTLVYDGEAEVTQSPAGTDPELQKLLEENRKLKELLTTRREEHQQTYVSKPLDISEYETRKFYIDAMLEDAGWTEGKDWRNEIELGMSSEGLPYVADYVLYDDSEKPLAVIEAKRTGEDLAKGRKQGELYAHLLAQRWGQRPVVFLTNGFETRIIDGNGGERECAAFYSKTDLERFFRLQGSRTPLKNITVKNTIADRYYQKEAVASVCEVFERQTSRKALLVMAPGSGKTRTVIALCDVLLRYGWVRNILYLADRSAPATQAMRSFSQWLPELSVVNLCGEIGSNTPKCVFSTYDAITGAIDEIKAEGRKLLTCGYFDLVICDELQHSIYLKNRDLFSYFDAPLVGLTATPTEEIHKSIYETFGLSAGSPTYRYELAEAVKDNYLVDFIAVETKLKFPQELCASESDRHEAALDPEGKESPDKIISSTLNQWIFKDEIIRQALHVLMTQGIKLQQGNTLGKTILFASSHRHARKILDVFHKEYPHLPGFAEIIDTEVDRTQDLIDNFIDPQKMPRIAIAVDLLDSGIDVPSCLNLVFFKRVTDKDTFRQMLGRGNRLCPGLQDGEDKKQYYIFDFCGNFAFFRMDDPDSSPISLQGAIFRRKAQIALQLQAPAYQTPELTEYRRALVADMTEMVRTLNRESFSVRRHLKYVEIFSNPDHYKTLTSEKLFHLEEELAPLMTRENPDPQAARFDVLLYSLESAYLMGKKYPKARKDLRKKIGAVASLSGNQEISAQKKLLHKVLHTDYAETADVMDFEEIRKNLRTLLKYLPDQTKTYQTHILEDIASVE